MNIFLWKVCRKINRHFKPKSGNEEEEKYTKVFGAGFWDNLSVGGNLFYIKVRKKLFLNPNELLNFEMNSKNQISKQT